MRSSRRRLLIVLHVGERDLGPTLLLVAQVEGARGHEHRRAVEVGGDRGRIGALQHYAMLSRPLGTYVYFLGYAISR